jgi:hypothetical protein
MVLHCRLSSEGRQRRTKRKKAPDPPILTMKLNKNDNKIIKKSKTAKIIFLKTTGIVAKILQVK